MRHRKAGVKLNRTTSHRQAMFRNMVTSLLKHDRIQTTDVKAKELRRWVDHIITLAKRGDLHARRQAMAIVREKNVVHKLFEEAEQRFGKVNGGYSRIVKIGRRPGDAAPISLIELIATEAKPKKSKKKGAEPKAKTVTPEKAKPAPDAGASTEADKGQDTKPKAPETAAAEKATETQAKAADTGTERKND
jgi:large subunit ribosomal protein L17